MFHDFLDGATHKTHLRLCIDSKLLKSSVPSSAGEGHAWTKQLDEDQDPQEDKL